MNSKYGPAGKIAHFFIDSKLSPLIIIASVLLGLAAVIALPREEEPQIIVPMIDIFVSMPGSDSTEVEQRVTRPMEKLLWEIPGVEYIYSTSAPGMSMAVVRFLVGQNEEESIVRLQSKLMANMDRIPCCISPPLIAVYAVRAGINTVVFDKGLGGGLTNVTPKIENYPGFESISGMDLMEKMKQHALKYNDIFFREEANKIEKIQDIFKIVTDKKIYNTKALILCTGTEYRKLNAPGEIKLSGKGVSYCATCDGFFFKGKKVVVIGGGNSALIEAIFLKQVGCTDVFLIHRRDQLRAEKIYQNEAIKKGVKIIYNTHVESINGTDQVEYLDVHDIKTEKKSKFSTNTVENMMLIIGLKS